jgi:D-aspartate ligase
VDKQQFAALLGETGLPHPFTVPVRSASDLDAIPATGWTDAFLKPCDSQRFYHEFGRKALRVSGHDHAVRELERFVAAGHEMVIQEYVPGPPTNHVFIDGHVDGRGGVVVLARRRLRMFPPDFGNSSLMVTVHPQEVAAAVDAVTRLVRAMEYRGLFSVEVKYDPRDNAPRILELNARAWWYVDFATRCGLNLCERAFRDALDESLPAAPPYRTGVMCVYPQYDREAARPLIRQGLLSRSTLLQTWLTSEQPVLMAGDPGPWAADVAGRAVGRLRRSLSIFSRGKR